MGTTNSSRTSSSSSSRHSPEKYNKSRNDKTYNRRAHHAGSWYSSSSSTLDAQLTSFLSDAERDGGDDKTTTTTIETSSRSLPRAIIAPHAGYNYSGPTAAYAYLALKEAVERNGSGDDDEGRISTIVVLHPSHHVYLDGCAVSGAQYLETPLGNLPVATPLRDELLSTGHFTIMERDVDEDEHSGEMQYPYIAKITSSRAGPLSVLPIMIGSLSPSREAHFGTILAPILARPRVFTVISSDFCHWGARFGYAPRSRDDRRRRISEYIEELDREGLRHISLQDPGAFSAYLKRTKNTICGRHPISVWLRAIEEGEGLDVTFVKYAQSGVVTSATESSVSYASGVARVTMTT